MKQLKTFIAISSESLNGKLVVLNTSSGESIVDEDGIHVKTALDFLFSLVHKRKKQSGIVFVCYAFQRDNEFMFSTLPNALKDKLFVSEDVKNKIERTELENEDLDEVYYSVDLDSQAFEQADFERYVNHLSLKELIEVEYEGYKIKLANGKILTINRNGKSLTIYDLFGFFKPHSLTSVYKRWFPDNNELLAYRHFELLPELSSIEKLKIHSTVECKAVAEVGAKLWTELSRVGINLRSWHGASAITSYWLGKYGAKKQYHNYRYRRQHSPEHWKAKRQAFLPARSEQLKLGTLKDVNVYDINSAYAFASTFLPCLLRKPIFSDTWQPGASFSVWFIEYDFTTANPYFGLLPNRDLNTIRYKLRGKTYAWQPEVSWLLANYPDCVEVKGGFVYDQTPAPFAKGIRVLYDLRLELQRQKNPLEKVIKLALTNFYGKFCQHNGKGHYYNLDYAGFITSFTRAQLLEATHGNEKETICFQTDAIHTTAELPINIGSDLGEYKKTRYSDITYLDNGVYRARVSGQVVKEKTRGFRSFNFTNALAEIKDKRTYTALAEFFIGHNLFTQNQFKGIEYLADYSQDKTFSPVTRERSAMRLFEVLDVDLTEGYIDSKAVDLYNGQESSCYRVGNYRARDLSLDTIEAGRI